MGKASAISAIINCFSLVCKTLYRKRGFIDNLSIRDPSTPVDASGVLRGNCARHNTRDVAKISAISAFLNGPLFTHALLQLFSGLQTFSPGARSSTSQQVYRFIIVCRLLRYKVQHLMAHTELIVLKFLVQASRSDSRHGVETTPTVGQPSGPFLASVIAIG